MATDARLATAGLVRTDRSLVGGRPPAANGWAESEGGQGSAPVRVDAPLVVPESTRYRLKRRLLGSPLHTEQLAHERLGRPTALAVFGFIGFQRGVTVGSRFQLGLPA
jgi:hypothetical protein